MRRADSRPEAERNQSLFDDSFSVLPLFGQQRVCERELLVVAMEEGREDDDPGALLDSLAANLMVPCQLPQDSRGRRPQPEALQENRPCERTVRATALRFLERIFLLFGMQRQQSERSIRREGCGIEGKQPLDHMARKINVRVLGEPGDQTAFLPSLYVFGNSGLVMVLFAVVCERHESPVGSVADNI